RSPRARRWCASARRCSVREGRQASEGPEPARRSGSLGSLEGERVFIIGNFIGAVATVLDVLLNALLLIILINALLSWVRVDASTPIIVFLGRVSDAVCDPIRRLFPTTAGGIDFAPFIAMLAIVFIQRFAIASLHELALRLG